MDHDRKPKIPAYDAGLILLGRRDYSRQGMIRKLRGKGYSDEEVVAAVDTLIERGYLREEAYASARAGALIRRGYAGRAVKERLSREAIRLDEGWMASKFEEVGLSEEEQIREAVERRLAFAGGVPDDREGRQRVRNRVASYLARRGHALDKVFAELDRQMAGRG